MKNYNPNDIEIICKSTGEIIKPEGRIVELSPDQCVVSKGQKDFLAKQGVNKFTNTPFVWLKFIYEQDLFDDIQISAPNITRLIFAATYCKSDGSLMSKKELFNIMHLSKTIFYDFLDEMIKSNILYEKDDIIYINHKYIYVGKSPENESRIRLFCDCIRSIYLSTTPSKHAILSYVFKIIPYVNRRTNVVCSTGQQKEQVVNRIKSVKFGEFCDLVGYDKTHAKRLAKELLKFEINGQPLFGFFIVREISIDKWNLIINPLLYFGGIKDEMYYCIRQHFEEDAKERRVTHNEPQSLSESNQAE